MTSMVRMIAEATRDRIGRARYGKGDASLDPCLPCALVVDARPDGRVMRVLLGDRECALQWNVEMGHRRLGDERVGRPADQVGNMILQRQVRDRHVRTKQLLMACDRLDDVPAVMQYEL